MSALLRGKKWTKWADWHCACSWDKALAGHWAGTHYAGKTGKGLVLGSLNGTSHFLGSSGNQIFLYWELLGLVGLAQTCWELLAQGPLWGSQYLLSELLWIHCWVNEIATWTLSICNGSRCCQCSYFSKFMKTVLFMSFLAGNNWWGLNGIYSAHAWEITENEGLNIFKCS